METENLKQLKTGTGINIETGGMGAITEENKDVSILEQKIAVIKGEIPRQYIKDDAIYYIVDDDNRLKEIIIRGQALGISSSGGGGGDNYYILPDTGIPQTDLSQEVQDSLERADTAIQGLSIGSTTTGNPGTNAEVTNSGTQTNPILNFTIPRGNPGETSYLHIKYSQVNPTSDSEIHGTFTTGDKWIGICSNNSSTDPGTYTSYAWMMFVGDNGKNGSNGESAYLHIKYSQDNPTSDAEIHGTFTQGDEWIGICSNNTQTAPGTYTSYSWMKFVGDSAFDIWKEVTGRTGDTEEDFIDSLSAHIENFIYADYDSTAAALSIGDTISSIPGVTNATPRSIILMPNGSPTSTATMMFSVKYTESNISFITSGEGQNIFPGYVRSDGVPSVYLNCRYCKVNVTGYNKVRFLGLIRETVAQAPNYCAFYDSNDQLLGSAISLGFSGTSVYFHKEFEFEIPQGAVYFRCNYESSASTELQYKIYITLINSDNLIYTYIGNMGIDEYILTNQDKTDIATIVEGSIIIPTKLSDLTDDLGTSPLHTHSQYATTTYVDGLVGNINTILTSIVGS